MDDQTKDMEIGEAAARESLLHEALRILEKAAFNHGNAAGRGATAKQREAAAQVIEARRFVLKQAERNTQRAITLALSRAGVR